MTAEQAEVAMSSNLTALTAMVPSEVGVGAVAAAAVPSWGPPGPYKEHLPLLNVVIRHHECTEEGHATVQYLLDQGADPNVQTETVILLLSVLGVGGQNLS